MKRKFFSGSTLDQVVMMAARHYGIEVDQLAYRQIEKKHGFLRTRKAVMIAVDPEQPRREAEAEAAVRPEIEAHEAEPPPAREAGPEPVAAAAPPEPRWEPPAPAPQRDDVQPGPMGPMWDPPSEKLETATELVEDEPAAATEAADTADTAAVGPVEEGAESVEASAARAEAPPVRGDHDEELLDAAEDAAEMLMRFAGIEAEATAESGEERIEIEVEGPESTVLVVEGGKGLLAIQHLLPRMLRGMTGRSSFVRVDSRDFHSKRRARLEALAAKEAEAASRTGRPRTLPPMAPDERRIVHLALQDSPAVETESRGTGLHKRVVVRPVSGDGGTDDIEARHGF